MSKYDEMNAAIEAFKEAIVYEEHTQKLRLEAQVTHEQLKNANLDAQQERSNAYARMVKAIKNVNDEQL